MAGGSRIVAFGSGDGVSGAEDILSEAEAPAPAPPSWQPEANDFTADEQEPERDRTWLAPALAAVAVLGWTAFYAWANQAAFSAPSTPAQWSGWISAWAVPVLLVCAVWLIAMRTSRREARRFGDAARALNSESSRLEERLSTVNQELSLAREFIAAQSRDLESLGRIAVERISQHADRLTTLIRDNGAQVDAIGSVSAAALDNMERLRGQLPVIASSAKDVTNNIANAGRTAHGQLGEMINGFNRLNEFGQASERQVETLRGRIDAAISAFAEQARQLDEIAAARFDALNERSLAFRAQLDGDEVHALAGIRNRAGALAAELQTTRAALDAQEAECLTSLRARVAAIRDEAAGTARALRGGETEALEAWRSAVGQLEADMSAAAQRIEELDRAALETAQARLTQLVEDADRIEAALAERHQAYESELARRHDDAAAREAESLAELDRRFARIDAGIAQRQEETAGRETAILARLDQQFASFDAEIARRESEARARAEALTPLFGAQLGDLDHALADRRAAHEAQTAALSRHAGEIAAQLDAFAQRMAQAAEHGSEAEARLTRSLTALTGGLADSQGALDGTDAALAHLTDSAVRLLELIQAGARHSREDLAAAIAASEARLQTLESRALMLSGAVDAAAGRSEALSSYVLAAHGSLGESLEKLETLHDGIAHRAAEHAGTLAELHAGLAAVEADSARVAESAGSALRSSIDELSSAARQAVAAIESESAAAVSTLAHRVGEESGAAIDRAVRTRMAEITGQLEQAAAHSAGIGREAAIQLRDQLAKVNELAGNLEHRVAHARQKAEENVDNDFSRRVALITESLNSHAIDIAKALDTDVGDVAWSSYLKGDRGIFTRRAVRLLDTAEARTIAQIYESDRTFRDHVSHYIHDFEAMLRQLLSTRDGHALGVTVLSSDMGKLYVALAQAIERLRN